MLPYISLGSLQISTYALMYTLGFLVAGSLVLQNIPPEPKIAHIRRNALIITVIFILVGLFVPAVIESFIRSWITGQPPQEIAIRVYYALGAGLLACFLYLRKHNINFLAEVDRTIPFFALGFGIARCGCLGAGCCCGRLTNNFFSMYSADEFGVWGMRYPTQLMSIVSEFILFAFLLRLLKKRPTWLKNDGMIFYLYIFFFCLERFLLDFLRQDHQPLFGQLGLPQLWMILGMTVAVFALFLNLPSKNTRTGVSR